MLVPIDLALALPDGLYMQLASRSGLAAHHRVQVIGGVIDKDYRGNVKIVLPNLGSSDFAVKCRDRIAQMLVLPTPDFILVEVDTLQATQRSTLGFGSTGVASAKATLNNVTGERPGCEQIPTINVWSIGGPTDDVAQYISSDICFCRGNRCRCHVGRNAWSVFKRLRSSDIQPEDTCLPIRAPQHSPHVSRVHHILGSGKVHQVPLTHDGDQATHSANIFKVVDNGPKIEDPKFSEYLQFGLDEFSRDVLSRNVPRTDEDIVRGPFGYARIFKKPEAVPKHQRPFPYLGERGEALGEIVKRNLHVRGWLEEVCGGSDWSSPPFTVPKPVPADSPRFDNWRLVIDFRYLNSQTREDQAPLPLIEDMLEKHESHQIISVLDLKHGFHQMRCIQMTGISQPCPHLLVR